MAIFRSCSASSKVKVTEKVPGKKHDNSALLKYCALRLYPYSRSQSTDHLIHIVCGFLKVLIHTIPKYDDILVKDPLLESIYFKTLYTV